MGQTLSSPITDKHTSGDANKHLIYGKSAMQGWRIRMEDAYTAVLNLEHSGVAFFGVYDGHKGNEAALYTSSELHGLIRNQSSFTEGGYEHAIKNGYLDIDRDLRKQFELKSEEESPSSGCTAVTALITDNKLYVGNAGDSRAVLSSKCKAIPLSSDHKPRDKTEYARISAAGGRVRNGRVNGDLALSRAIGDFKYKTNPDLKPEEQIVTAFPDVTEHNMDLDDEFLIIASDGIWECYSSQAVVSFVAEHIAKNNKLETICEMLMDECITPDAETSVVGRDNMTMIIIGLLQDRSKDEWRDAIQSHLEETKTNGVFTDMSTTTQVSFDQIYHGYYDDPDLE
jgi:protein phosphatase PTC2/3